MSFLSEIFNPPPEQPKPEDQYQFDEKVFVTLQALTYIMNPSVVTNANFATLGSSGLTPITQADGDGAEFSAGWNVYGAANATYTITPTPYPTGAITGSSPSTIPSGSAYYINLAVTAHNGNDFYFYQQQAGKIRKYQQDYFTYGIIAYNNQNKVIKIRLEMYNFYDPTGTLIADNSMYLQPGLNRITSQIKTESLSGETIGAGNYVQFRLAFRDLVDGTADINFYQIKCEFGTVSTLLEQ